MNFSLLETAGEFLFEQGQIAWNSFGYRYRVQGNSTYSPAGILLIRKRMLRR